MMLASSLLINATPKALQVPKRVSFDVTPVGPSRYCNALPTVGANGPFMEAMLTLKSHCPVTCVSGMLTGIEPADGPPSAASSASDNVPDRIWMLLTHI